MKLKELRESIKISQSDLAKKINISQSNYSKYEKEIIEPNIETLIKLANFFQVSTDFLLEHKLHNTPAGEFYQLTDKQKELIPLIKQLDDGLCARVSGFIEAKLNDRIQNKKID